MGESSSHTTQPRPLNEIPSLHASSLRAFSNSQGLAPNQQSQALPNGHAALGAGASEEQPQQQTLAKSSPNTTLSNGHGAYGHIYSVPHPSEVPKQINAAGKDHPQGGPLMELNHARSYQTDSPPPVELAEESKRQQRQSTAGPKAPVQKRSGFFGKIVECFRPSELFNDPAQSANRRPPSASAQAKGEKEGLRHVSPGAVAPQDKPLQQQTHSAGVIGGNNNSSSSTHAPAQQETRTAESSANRPKKWWMNSKTPMSQLPQPWTWEAYGIALNNQEMDPNDPPITPGNATASLIPDSIDEASVNLPDPKPESATGDPQLTPYQRRMMPAPVGISDPDRQRTVHRLDVFGRHGPPTLGAVKSSKPDLQQQQRATAHVTPEEQAVPVEEKDLYPTLPENMLSTTLEGHDQFKKLVRYARRTFGTPLSMISVVDEDRLLYLAETGLGLTETPRDINFCGWTLLSSVEGFTINDTHKDWRFINNPLVTTYGARFYAGCPIFAPELYPGQDVQAVGTICICDMQPREFTSEDRKKLMRLADLVRKEIATWHEERLASKMRLLNTRLSSFHHRVGHIHDPKMRSKESLSPSMAGAPATYEADEAELAAWGSDDLDSVESGSTVLSVDDVDSTPSRIFSLATRLISKTLDLPLSYLIEVQFDAEQKSRVTAMTLLSSQGLADPPPTFDDRLHLKAIRSPEGGLLYQNPVFSELHEGERLPKSATPESAQYASAILVRVLETETSGFVLAGFADATRATFGMEDLDFIRRVADEVRPFCRERSPGVALPVPTNL